jgi:hypothetical protein
LKAAPIGHRSAGARNRSRLSSGGGDSVPSSPVVPNALPARDWSYHSMTGAFVALIASTYTVRSAAVPRVELDAVQPDLRSVEPTAAPALSVLTAPAAKISRSRARTRRNMRSSYEPPGQAICVEW